MLSKFLRRVSTRLNVTLRPLSLLALLSLMASGNVLAEGSRTIHPAGATGVRGVMSAGHDSSVFGTVANNNQFLYVYAEAGEVILLGSRNRSNGGDVFVYNPQSFGNKGAETIPATPAFSCSSQTGRGTIASRDQELAGPNSADGTATVTNGYNPCWYQVPTSGIHGVRFTGATSGTSSNTGLIATPQILPLLVSAWDVTVRPSEDSLVDLDGRLFTYAWVVRTGSNGANYRLYNSLYYISSDGYRYKQTFQGSDPNAAAFYANSRGFIDNGAPLYRDIRGSNYPVSTGPSFTAGITVQRPQYPLFFSDIAPAGPNVTQINKVLGTLGIPVVPLTPQLTNPVFIGNVVGNESTVSGGGLFQFDTLNTLSYEIVISLDGVDFDPANTSNRVLTGIALSGSHSIIWDGNNNNGVPFPVGNYQFRITGRNGEIHFPTIDLEGNFNGGPTLAKLNGAQDTTVYYDDRGYRAANGTLLGELNGHLCGAANLQVQPSPNYSLLGLDSSNSNFGGSGSYYRKWSGSTDGNADCKNLATEFFGTAKGLDLWALEKSDETFLPIVIVPVSSDVDVGTLVTVTAVVEKGDTAFGSFVFNNVGAATATGVTYAVTIGNPADPSTCPAAVTFPLLPTGVSATYSGAPLCEVSFTGMPTILTPGQTLTFNFNYIVGVGNNGPIPVNSVITATNETPGAPAPNTAQAVTIVPLPAVSVVKSSSPLAGELVQVGETITYTLTAAVTNTALTAPLVLDDALGAGLTFGSVTSAGAFTCSGTLQCTLPIGTIPGTYTVTYTAIVNSSAGVTVANNVTANGGGGTPPTCGTCSISHPISRPIIDVIKSSNPASGTEVIAGQTISYTLTATVTDASLSTDLVLTDTLGTGLTFGSVTSAGAYTANVTGAPVLTFTR